MFVGGGVFVGGGGCAWVCMCVCVEGWVGWWGMCVSGGTGVCVCIAQFTWSPWLKAAEGSFWDVVVPPNPGSSRQARGEKGTQGVRPELSLQTQRWENQTPPPIQHCHKIAAAVLIMHPLLIFLRLCQVGQTSDFCVCFFLFFFSLFSFIFRNPKMSVGIDRTILRLPLALAIE